MHQETADRIALALDIIASVSLVWTVGGVALIVRALTL